jgi:uncharacterized RDD family membrane protein YckC
MDAYQRHELSCFPLLWHLLALLAAVRLPAVWSGRRQTLNDRLAGTIVVDDR